LLILSIFEIRPHDSPSPETNIYSVRLSYFQLPLLKCLYGTNESSFKVSDDNKSMLGMEIKAFGSMTKPLKHTIQFNSGTHEETMQCINRTCCGSQCICLPSIYVLFVSVTHWWVKSIERDYREYTMSTTVRRLVAMDIYDWSMREITLNNFLNQTSRYIVYECEGSYLMHK